MTTARLNGVAVVAMAVHLPAWGVWWADVELADTDEIEGEVELELPGLTLSGTVMSGGVWEEKARYRIAGGAGTWGKAIKARSYSNDAGVALAKVLGDAAADCGEELDATTASGTVGSAWTREAGPASRALHLLARQNWYVGEDGTTRVGKRAQATYTGDGTIVDQDPDRAMLELAADDLAELVPGVVVAGVEAVDVVHRLEGGKLRTDIWGSVPSPQSRIASAFERIIGALTASLRFSKVWSYRVVAQNGERLDLQADRASSGMPDLLRVRVRFPSGFKLDHKLGSMVLVAFVDGDPARPVVIGGDDPESPGWTPSRMDLVGADDAIAADVGGLLSAGRAVRYGDTVMMPSGSAATPTPTVVRANDVAPNNVSRVRP